MRSTTSGRGRSRASPSTAVTPAPRHPPPQSGTRPLVATFDKSGGKRREEGQRREPHQRGPPRGFRGVVPLLSVGIVSLVTEHVIVSSWVVLISCSAGSLPPVSKLATQDVEQTTGNHRIPAQVKRYPCRLKTRVDSPMAAAARRPARTASRKRALRAVPAPSASASAGSFQQRKPPGLEQRDDGVDLGLWCGVVRVCPQYGSGVVQTVELVCGFCHAATRRADRMCGEQRRALADAADGDRFRYPPGAAAERFRVHETARGFHERADPVPRPLQPFAVRRRAGFEYPRRVRR